jgi:hypothetical protein
MLLVGLYLHANVIMPVPRMHHGIYAMLAAQMGGAVATEAADGKLGCWWIGTGIDHHLGKESPQGKVKAANDILQCKYIM